MIHQSVMTDEVISILKPGSGRTYFDGTFGAGGHTRAILRASSPLGRVVAVDKDSRVASTVEEVRLDFPNRFKFKQLSYDKVNELGELFDGAVLDLGLSSDQLEGLNRGFSYSRDEYLDMRFDDSVGRTASDILNRASYEELIKIFRDYAEDRRYKGLVIKVIERRKVRPIVSTFDLVEIVGTKDKKVLSPIFAGLRIAVNDEFTTLKSGLENIAQSLAIGAALVVISFHSGEDRIVKNFLRTHQGIEILTKKPILPSKGEQLNNPRSRSAKLRAGRIII